MKNYSKEPDLLKVVSVRVSQKTIDQVAEIHCNFSEVVRDALESWIKLNSEYVKESFINENKMR